MVLHRLVLYALVAGLAALAGLLLWLVTVRVARAFRAVRERRLESRYRPLVDAALAGGSCEPLVRAPGRHRAVIARLLLAPLASIAGDIVGQARAIASVLGLTDRWLSQIGDRRWWRRAEAAQALGLLTVESAVDPITRLLDDSHESVRSAAVNALGLLGDRRAVPHLLRCAARPERYPHVRVMRSLRRFGASVTAAAVDLARQDPAYLEAAVDVLSCCGGPEAIDPLLEWTVHVRPEVRAAVWLALASIGPDDRAYYHARRAEHDPDPAVRDAAARVIARSGRVREAA